MLRLIPTLFLIASSLSVAGQDAFYKYKKVADELISHNFAPSLIPLIKCKDFDLNLPDGTTTASYPSYEKFKLEKEKVSQITFTYVFLSPAINNPFSFTITLDSRKRPVYKKVLFENVPMCIKMNTACDFLSKDSAVKIALNDSLKYSENLSTTLEQAPHTNIFYWVVEGQPIQKRVKKVNYGSGYLAADYRYINAVTGGIISRQKFYENAR